MSSVLPNDHPKISTGAADPSKEHEIGAAYTLLIAVVLLFSLGLGIVMKEHHHIFKYFPESAMSILIGIMAGGFVRIAFPKDARLVTNFDPEIFFFIMLPPIIFDAGYTLKKKRFFSNFGTILLFAVVGTLISSLVIGCLVYSFALLGWIPIETDSPLQSFMFGSLISSVDPVATLSIMGDPSTNIDPTLYSLVFGESVLNDVVAIVLFRVLLKYVEQENKGRVTNNDFSFGDLGSVLIQFIVILVGSIVIGIVCGLICSFMFKKFNVSKYHVFEVEVLFITAFACFALSELLQMSGVMAVFFCAVTLSYYNFHNLSNPSKITSVHVSETLAKIAETVVMISIGMSIFSSYTYWNAGFVILGLIFCFISRACNIFPLSFVANKFRKRKITWNMQIVLFYSGLRGSVSYALSMQLVGSGSEKSVEIVQTTTLMIIIITTLLLGGTTEPILNCLDVKNGSTKQQGDSKRGAISALSDDYQLREDYIGRSFREADGKQKHTINFEENEEDNYEDFDLLVRQGDDALYPRLSQEGERVREVENENDMIDLDTLRFWARMDILYFRPMFGGRALRQAVTHNETEMQQERSEDGNPFSTANAVTSSSSYGTIKLPDGVGNNTKS